MKYDILVQTMVNDQPEHIFVQHHGVHEGKVLDLFLETVEEQYQRLERGKPDFYIADFKYSNNGVIMSRDFGGNVTTVNVVYVPTEQGRPYWLKQEALKHGEA